MTIKIIRSAEKPKPRIIECKCGCRFSFEREDATYHRDARDGNYWTVKCPECDAQVVMTADAVGWPSK